MKDPAIQKVQDPVKKQKQLISPVHSQMHKMPISTKNEEIKAKIASFDFSLEAVAARAKRNQNS